MARLIRLLNIVIELIHQQLQEIMLNPVVNELHLQWQQLRDTVAGADSPKQGVVLLCVARQEWPIIFAHDGHLPRLLLEQRLQMPGQAPLSILVLTYRDQLTVPQLQFLSDLLQQAFCPCLLPVFQEMPVTFPFLIPVTNDVWRAVQLFQTQFFQYNNFIVTAPPNLMCSGKSPETFSLQQRCDGQWLIASGSDSAYLLMICRFIHHLHTMLREKIGLFHQQQLWQQLLHAWLWPYTARFCQTARSRAQMPLRDFTIVCEQYNVAFAESSWQITLCLHAPVQQAQRKLALTLHVGGRLHAI